MSPAAANGLGPRSGAESQGGDPGAQMPTPNIPNLRDIGGYPTTDGRHVRLGLVYRSTALARADDADLDVLAGLGLRTIFDLRTAAERSASPDRSPQGVREIDLDVLADEPEAAAAHIPELTSDPAKASEVLASTDITAIFDNIYRGLVTLPSAVDSYRRLFLALAEEGTLPALYHCTTGKDRTGWATAALLTLLGVAEDVVVEDYLRSNDYLMAGLQPMLDAFAAGGGDAELLKPVIGVKAEYLRSALEIMHSRYGTVEGYFADGLSVDVSAQQRLRELFLH